MPKKNFKKNVKKIRKAIKESVKNCHKSNKGANCIICPDCAEK